MEDCNPLRFYTIYDNPADYPGFFIVRMSEVKQSVNEKGELQSEVFHDKNVLFKSIYPIHCQEFLHRSGLTCIGRDTNDDPVIFEVWI